MAGNDTLIAFFLFVVIILLGVLLFFLVVDRLDYNDTSTPTGNVVKEYYFIQDNDNAPRQYSGRYRSSCLGSFFSCLLSCPEDEDNEDLIKKSCTSDCEDDLYYSCSQRDYFNDESDANIQRYQCLESCYDDGSYDKSCTKSCIY